jgi:flagella basal body P-ring formation protein FlgA
MKTISLFMALLVFATTSAAETLTSVRAIRPLTIISAEDIGFLSSDVPGALRGDVDISGLEARITLYPGRPIRPGDVGPPALVERNQLVPLIYQDGGLIITAEGRALGRAAAGEWVRVMNIASRTTVSGQVADNGTVFVFADANAGRFAK